MNVIKLFSLFAIISFYPDLIGQDVLTREDAIFKTIENNYGIKLAKNDIRIAQNNTSKEINGYMPVVDVNAGPSTSFGGSTQKFNSGMSAEVRNAFSWSAGASVTGNYTLYDKSRDVRLDQLKEVLNLSDLQLRQTIENTLIQLFAQYFQVAQLSENLKVLKETLGVSRRRLERAKLRYEYSQGTRLDMLNAEVDIDRDSVNYLNIQQQLSNSKRSLNVIMGVPVDTEFEIDPRVEYLDNISREQMTQNGINNNVSVLLSDQNQIINEMELEIIDSDKKPKIAANGGLNYNYQGNAPASFITSSSSTGLSLGVTLNWNIFDGGRRKILNQNAKIAVESQSIFKEQIISELERDIANAWDAYTNALFVLEVEENSLETNRLNLQRTEELYSSGQVTSVEFRQAQLNLLNSETGYNSAKYNAKLMELELLFLSGDILTSDE